jgi:hypothetical protein
VTFKVTQEDGIFHVVPTNFVNKDGKLEQKTPILDTRITILPKQRTRIDLFGEICQSLTKSTGIPIHEGTFPRNGPQARISTSISGSDVTARSLLSQLMAEFAAPQYSDIVVEGPDGQRRVKNLLVHEKASLTWKLLYAPGWGYALNLLFLDVGRK